MSGEDSLVAALARAQAVMPPIAKGHTNPHFGSRYADIADVLAVIRPVLAAEGIALVQPIEVDDDGRAFLVTKLMKGGEEIVSRMPLQIDQKAQDLGSRLTYQRRYAACALVGVAAEDDDDGHAASQAPTRTRTARERPYVSERGADPSGAPTGPGVPSTEKQQQMIMGLFKETTLDSTDDRKGLVRVITGKESVKALTKGQASAVIDVLQLVKDGTHGFVWDNSGGVHVKPNAEKDADPFLEEPS